MISSRPWYVRDNDDGEAVVHSAAGRKMLVAVTGTYNEETEHAVACVNTLHEAGIEPADLPKFVEAVRKCWASMGHINDDVSREAYYALKNSAARLPENKR